MLRELDSRYGQTVQFRYLDYFDSSNGSLLSRYAVRGHPTTVFLNADGEVETRIAGITRPSSYIQAIEQIQE